MTQKPSMLTCLALILGAASSGALAQAPQATLMEAVTCLPRSFVEKAEKGEITYYVVCIKQLDGTRKEVKYTKNERGVIVVPETGSALLDGSPLTGDPIRDRATNRQIIGKYDKDKQIALAVTGPGNLYEEALRKRNAFTKKVEANTANPSSVITQQEFFETYYASYFLHMGDNSDYERARGRRVIDSIDTMAKTFKFSVEEIETMKQKAKEEAQQRWRAVTGSLD